MRRGRFTRIAPVGSLMLAYIVTATFYSITEAGFRVLSPSWIFLLLAAITASAVSKGFIGSWSAKGAIRVPVDAVVRTQEARQSQGQPPDSWLWS